MQPSLAKLVSVVAMTDIALSSPVALESRQFDGTRPDPFIECKGALFPNYPTCNDLIQTHWGTDRTLCVNPRVCHVYNGDGNCRLSWCNNENFEVCQATSTLKSRAEGIVSACQPQTAGGYQSAPSDEPWTEIALRPTLATLRSMLDINTSTNLMGVAVPPSDQIMSVEQNDAEVAEIEAVLEALSQHTAAKRQQSGDDTFVVTVRSLGIEKPGARYPVTGAIGSGSYTLQESTSQTLSISTGVDIGSSFFDVMSASIGIEVSSSFQSTSAEGITVDIDCGDKTGIVLWAPLHNYYEGRFEPSGETASIYVPIDHSARLDNYPVRCLG